MRRRLQREVPNTDCGKYRDFCRMSWNAGVRQQVLPFTRLDANDTIWVHYAAGAIRLGRSKGA